MGKPDLENLMKRMLIVENRLNKMEEAVNRLPAWAFKKEELPKEHDHFSQMNKTRC